MSALDRFRRISVADVKFDLLRMAYDNDRAFLNRLDPRVVLLWTGLFLVVPWLFFDPAPLAALAVGALALAAVSQVSKYLLALLLWGTLTNIGLVVGLTAFAGGGAALAAADALLPLVLKLTVVSLVTLAVVSALSPRRISVGLLGLGVPRQVTFAVAYGYRMLPVLVTAYTDIVDSLRLRSKAPENRGLLGWRHYRYLLGLAVRAFYPLVFDVAKRSRVTVEAMETQGFSESLGGGASRDLRLADLRVRPRDLHFVAGSLLYVLAASTLL